MKILPSAIVNVVEKKDNNINPILFYGNESGLISKLIKSIYNKLKEKLDFFEIIYFDYNNVTNESLTDTMRTSSLFSKNNFIVLTSPKESLIKVLELFDNNNNFLIINGSNINSKSRLKSYFDNHQKFISVPCYAIDKKTMKKIIDDFLSQNNINIQREAYWFLIDNITEDFLSLENELQKLLCFKNSTVTLDDLQTLIVQKHYINTDNYFINCATGRSDKIIKEINASNPSISESYEILLSIKKFINILSIAILKKDIHNLDELVKFYWPKYLFLTKDVFKEVLKKNDVDILIKINKMIQKTESLLRKNTQQHKEVLERFLLNLVKIIK